MSEIERILIFHSNDFDGIASGVIMKEKYPNGILLPYDYGNPLHLPVKGVPVVMADVSLPMKKMFEVAEYSDFQFTWIDHHKSAIDDYNKFVKRQGKFVTTILEEGTAGCELTWRHFFPRPVPHGIRLLGRYDVWDQNDPDEWEERILPFQYGLRAICNSVENFPKILLSNDSHAIRFINGIIENGKAILAYQKIQNEKMASAIAFEGTFMGYRVIAMNNSGSNSQLFESVYDPEEHDIMMPFYFNGSMWKVSLYTTKDEIDCSELAKTKKGGGHKKAAGFHVRNIEDLGIKSSFLNG